MDDPRSAASLESGHQQSRLRLLLLWLAGIDLRLTILAVPPLLPLIHRDLALDEKSVAVLSGLPLLLFGVMAVPGSLLIARIGARRALITGLLTVAIASGLRGAGASAAVLFPMTFAMGGGVSIMQPALPALVSRWFPASVALATAVYANGLLIGEVLGASLTIPLVLPLTAGSWEWSFALWAVPVLLTALLMISSTAEVPLAATARRAGWWPDWRDPRLWQLGLLQGGCSVLYFSCNTFIPDYLHATERGDLVNSCLTALNAGQLPASLVILLFARRLAGRRGPYIAAGSIGLLGLGGLLLSGAIGMIAGAAAIGFCSAFVLILTLALPPLLAAPEDVHRLSAGMLAIGYTLTFVVPFIGGAIWDASGSAATAFLPGAVGAAIVLSLGAMLRPPDRHRLSTAGISDG
ncbi:MAG TPA: MFS transporter [Stellaceae bacterium]|nr:MFS transporter [Stellaceae bacterium]